MVISQEVSMVYRRNYDGTIALVKKYNGEAFAFAEEITASNFVQQLHKLADLSFLIRREVLLVDTRFPILVIGLAEMDNTELYLLAKDCLF